MTRTRTGYRSCRRHWTAEKTEYRRNERGRAVDKIVEECGDCLSWPVLLGLRLGLPKSGSSPCHTTTPTAPVSSLFIPSLHCHKRRMLAHKLIRQTQPDYPNFPQVILRGKESITRNWGGKRSNSVIQLHNKLSCRQSVHDRNDRMFVGITERPHFRYIHSPLFWVRNPFQFGYQPNCGRDSPKRRNCEDRKADTRENLCQRMRCLSYKRRRCECREACREVQRCW